MQLSFQESKKRYTKFLKFWILECLIVTILTYIVVELGYDFARDINDAWHGEITDTSAINHNYLYLYTSFDLKIPVVKIFIVPYLLTYPFWLLGPFLIYGFMGRKAFYRFACSTISFGILCFIIFVIAPNAITPDFRPKIDPNSTNPLDALLRLCYGADTLNNAFPSGHWGFTLLVAVGMRSAIFDKRSSLLRRSTAILAYIYAIIICLSTLFVKQHYIFDGVVAVVLVELLWFVFNHLKIVTIWERAMYRWNAQLGIVNDSKIKLYSGKKKVWNWVLWSLLVILMLVGLYYTNFIILQLASTLSFFLIWFIAITAYYLVPSKRRKTFRDYNTLQN